MSKVRSIGLLYPLRRGASDFAHGTGPDLLKSNIRKVVATKAASPDGVYLGEYPHRLNFGSQVDRMRHACPARIAKDISRVYVTDAVSRWEPRATVAPDAMQFTEEQGGQLLRMGIVYRESEAADSIGGELAEADVVQVTT